jgi:hypothetical protein
MSEKLLNARALWNCFAYNTVYHFCDYRLCRLYVGQNLAKLSSYRGIRSKITARYGLKMRHQKAAGCKGI